MTNQFPSPQDVLYAFLPASHPLIAGDPLNVEEALETAEEIAWQREANAPHRHFFYEPQRAEAERDEAA